MISLRIAWWRPWASSLPPSIIENRKIVKYFLMQNCLTASPTANTSPPPPWFFSWIKRICLSRKCRKCRWTSSSPLIAVGSFSWHSVILKKLNILGGLNYEQGVHYLRRKFQKLYRNQQKLYIHETCATDTNQLNAVFNSVLDTIVQENLKDTGMLWTFEHIQSIV